MVLLWSVILKSCTNKVKIIYPVILICLYLPVLSVWGDCSQWGSVSIPRFGEGGVDIWRKHGGITAEVPAVTVVHEEQRAVRRGLPRPYRSLGCHRFLAALAPHKHQNSAATFWKNKKFTFKPECERERTQRNKPVWAFSALTVTLTVNV